MTNDYGKGDTAELLTDEESGRQYFSYPSGMSKWKDTGKFRSAPLITPVGENPSGMLQRRNEKSRQIAREAIDEGAGLDLSQWGTGEGWRRVIVHTVQTYLKSSNLRGMAETFSKIATAGGYLAPEAEKGRTPIHIDTVNVGIVGMVANLLAAKQLPATVENVAQAEVELVNILDEIQREQIAASRAPVPTEPSV